MTDDWNPDRPRRDQWGEPIDPPRPRRPASAPRRPESEPRRRPPTDPRPEAARRRPAADEGQRRVPPPRQQQPSPERPARQPRPPEPSPPRRRQAPPSDPPRRRGPAVARPVEHDEDEFDRSYIVGTDTQGYGLVADDEYYEGDYYEDDWVDEGRGRSGMLLLAGLLVVALVCVGGYVAFGDQIKELVTGTSAPDYAGRGNGTEVLVTIVPGDTGADVARTLHEEGVTKSFSAFYDLLLSQTSDVTFVPGVYSLQGEMSAQAALDAFRDPTTRVTNRVVIREGLSAADTFALLSEATGISVADFEAVAADHAALGVPAEAPSIEGFLFPATYELQPDDTAESLITEMVGEMIRRLDAAGVAPEDRLRIVTLASIIQREAGSVDEDFYKVSRVFHNRLEEGWKLDSDATVAYGRGHYDSVWTTDEERADASNPYNTYANPGLPVGPIGLPGELAIDAAANPVDGPWFYFVTVNLKTGETKFSENGEQHNRAVEELRAWCRASEENNEFCK